MKIIKGKGILVIIVFIFIFTSIFGLSTVKNSTRVEAATIKINKTNLTLYAGETYTLKIYGTGKNVEWSTSDKAVATVSSKGKVTAKKVGTIIVAGKVGSKKYTCKVTVKSTDFITKNSVLICYTGTDKNVTIPNSVTSICDQAFSGSTSITNVVIPNSITSIGEYAFSECTSLTNITIPDSVTNIGSYAFLGCTNLKSVVLSNSVTSISNTTFGMCSSLTSITIPNSVTNIGDSSFISCTNLTSVIIPNSVTCIGAYAFNSCNNLTNITIPSAITSIGDQAFSRLSDATKALTIICPKGSYAAIFAAKNNIAFEYNVGTSEETIDNTNEGGLITCNIELSDGKTVEVTGYFDEKSSYDVFLKVNELRESLGINKLEWNSNLIEYSKTRASELPIQYAHVRPNGQQGTEGLLQYIDPSNYSIGENIAKGQSSSSQVMEAWTNSPGHYKNMTNVNYNTVIVGCFVVKGNGKEDNTYYWVQLFTN